MLLIKSTETLKLERPALKVLKLSTALNGYVFITTSEDSFERLVHVDRQGKLLWEKAYADSIDTFGMFNEREVIVMNVRENLIEVVDLLTHSVRAYPHQYVFEDTSSMNLLVFNDSKLFCVVEKGSPADSRLFLTYYSYEADNVRPISAYKSQPGEWSYDQEYAQANNHSKVAWWRPKHEASIEFATYCLRDNNAGELASVKVNNTLGRDYNQNNFGLEIAHLWETAPHVYLLVCNTNREAKKEEPAPNNNFVLDARKEVIREARFSFPDRWNCKLIDCFNLGEVSAFHTFLFEKESKGQALLSPVFYVHNEREEIISVEQWRASSTVNFYIPGFDTSTVIEAQHANGDVDSIEVTTKRLMTQKEMYLHFMLHINEDFDDDLLQDAVELLTE
jgi:hypothetical protein